MNKLLRKYENLLNINATIVKDLFDKVTYPWEVLPMIGDYILKNGPLLSDEYTLYKDEVWIHKNVKISEKADINGPTIIDEGTEIRPGAYIRGNAIIGKNCVIGNSTEIKNSILFDNCKCPHYNYIGDSILGEGAHTGAGVILSNVKSDKSYITVKDKEMLETGLKKMGAILGDYSDIGCNSVICPGSIIGKYTNVYPLTMVRGVIKDKKIVKSMENIVDKKI